jgi:hypothetical protein
MRKMRDVRMRGERWDEGGKKKGKRGNVVCLRVQTLNTGGNEVYLGTVPCRR